MADGNGNGIRTANGDVGNLPDSEFRAATEVEQAREIRAATSVLLDRLQFMRQAGISFRGARDLYEVLGYNRILSYRDFRARYARGGIAKRVVEAYPRATWRGGVELWENSDPDADDTPFEAEWKNLEIQLKVWSVLQRVDILAGLSTYAVLLIGAPGDLSSELPQGKPGGLLYITPFSGGGGPGGDRLTRPMAMDADASIMEFDTDTNSPRFGLPITYQLKRTDLSSPNLQRPVHWSRVIHVAEGCLSDEVYGIPTLENVWNLLDDLDKVTGGGAEAFWLRANQGMHLDVAKDMTFPAPKPGEKSEVEKMREQSEEYQHGITRWLRTRGVTVTPLGSSVADFHNPADSILTQIAGSKGIPKRLLLGSEMGQLASGQDADNWDTQVMDRRTSYAGPSVVRPLADRLIKYGYLPKPNTYDVEWPSIQNLTEVEKAQGAKAMADVNNTAKMTVFSSAEMRDKWYGLDPAPDDPTEAYKFDGAKAWATVNKMMGITIFTPAEIRKIWYGFEPLAPDEAVPIAGPEKVSVTKPPAQAGDPNAVAEDAASVVQPKVPGAPKVPAGPVAHPIVPPNVHPIPAPLGHPIIPLPPVDGTPPLNPALHGPDYGAKAAQRFDELLTTLAAAIAVNDPDQIEDTIEEIRAMGGVGSGPSSSAIAKHASATANASGTAKDHTLAAVAHTQASRDAAAAGNDIAAKSHQRYADFHQQQSQGLKAAERPDLAATLQALESAVETGDLEAIDTILGISLRGAIDGPHSYSTTQVQLPPDIADAIFAFGASIPDDDLAADGRETDAHVTVLYGLNSSSDLPVRALLLDEPSVFLTLGETIVFETPEADVLVVRVNSPDLIRLNAKIFENLEVTSTYSEYKPHATICYLRPGLGQKYAGRTDLAGLTATINEVIFSPPEGEKVNISLK
jgi:hypothetical protein